MQWCTQRFAGDARPAPPVSDSLPTQYDTPGVARALGVRSAWRAKPALSTPYPRLL